MIRPEDIRDRMTNVRQIGGIISTLRTIATAHQNEAKGHLAAIRAQAQAVAGALGAALTLGGAFPEADRAAQGITIVVGAAQGFSGTFGERMAEAAQQAGAQGDALIVIGSRTIGALDDQRVAIAVRAEMAPHAPEVPQLAIRLSDALFAELAKRPGARVQMVYADPQDIATGPILRSLFPLDRSRFAAPSHSVPLINLSAAGLTAALIEEYVFTEICEGLMLGFAAENAARAEAMTRAQTAVKRIAADLRQQFQRARQEQMTTEIIELATGAEGASRG